MSAIGDWHVRPLLAESRRSSSFVFLTPSTDRESARYGPSSFCTVGFASFTRISQGSEITLLLFEKSSVSIAAGTVTAPTPRSPFPMLRWPMIGGWVVWPVREFRDVRGCDPAGAGLPDLQGLDRYRDRGVKAFATLNRSRAAQRKKSCKVRIALASSTPLPERASQRVRIKVLKEQRAFVRGDPLTSDA